MENNLQSHTPEQNNNHEQSSFVAKTKVALTSLLITMGAFSYGQTAIQGKTDTQTEQLTTTDDPKAKADVDTLMKKYNLTTIEDLSDKSPEEIISIRTDVIKLLWANQNSNYHLDKDIVKLRDEVRFWVDWYAPLSYDRSTYQTVVSRWEKLAKTDEKLAKTDEKLAKTDEKLAKTDEKLQEVQKIAKMLWIEK